MFSRRKSTTNFVSHRLSEEKVTISIGRETKHTFYKRQ